MECIRLESSDGHVFKIERRAVSRSRMIMKKLQLRGQDYNVDNNSPIVLDKIDGVTLKKVIEFCDRHYVPNSKETDVNSLNAFDAEFVNVDETTFFNLLQAAYYLKIKSLMDLVCGTLSKKFKGKNYEETGEVLENWKQNAD
ncbi:SKP1-like protein 9 [Apium graveolens]|uniref:SKP1-like protein 9 n=1 Tax=Apium graveolens TaxID=4045 RepID=UPI003D7BB81B